MIGNSIGLGSGALLVSLLCHGIDHKGWNFVIKSYCGQSSTVVILVNVRWYQSECDTGTPKQTFIHV